MKPIDKMDWDRFEAMQKSLRDQILMTNKYRRLYDDAQKDIAAQKIFNTSTMKLVTVRDQRIAELERKITEIMEYIKYADTNPPQR